MVRFFKTNILSKLLISICLLISCIFLFIYNKQSIGLHGDSLGYYMYLPSTFIYNNLNSIQKLPTDKNIPEQIISYAKDIEQKKSPLGFAVNQYTYGVALTELPFFLIAHAFEKVLGMGANGFSNTYFFLIKIGNIIYVLLGLILIYNILLNYFSKPIALMSTLTVYMCTNLFWFTLYQAGMSHVPLFFLYSLLIYLTIKIHNNAKLTYFIAAGFTSGLIIITRPTDIICLLIPILYYIYNKETIKNKIVLLKNNLFNIICFCVCVFLVALPQLVYWKTLSGKFLYYSYGNQSFDWWHPKIKEGLFYFCNGWFPYSPVMIFAVLGIFLTKHIRMWTLCIFIILPIYVYIIYSWYCYNYINGIGSRPMIHLYPLLAISLAAFINSVSNGKLFFKVSFVAIILFLTVLNLNYCMQQAKGILFSEESNMAYNYKMLFRQTVRYNDLVTRDLAERQPDSLKLTKIATLGFKDFTDSIDANYVKDTMYINKYMYNLTNQDSLQAIEIVYDKNKFKDAHWFKCSGDFRYPDPSYSYYKHYLMLELSPDFWKRCQIENKIGVSANGAENENVTLTYFKTNTWSTVYFFTKVPKFLKDGDKIRLMVWNNQSNLSLNIKNISLDLYK